MTGDVSEWGFDKPQQDAGQKHLSGTGIGCVTLVNQEIFISFNKTFHKIPKVNVFPSVTDQHDRIDISDKKESVNGFSCKITTYGRDGNKVCADSFLNWTANS